MSLNPGLEQDFRDTIKRCNEMVQLCRRGINEAASGDAENMAITLQGLHDLSETINNTVGIGLGTMDTFTAKEA